jgi:hypothetical protein
VGTEAEHGRIAGSRHVCERMQPAPRHPAAGVAPLAARHLAARHPETPGLHLSLEALVKRPLAGAGRALALVLGACRDAAARIVGGCQLLQDEAAVEQHSLARAAVALVHRLDARQP